MYYVPLEELISRMNILAFNRHPIEQAWADVALVAYPTLEDASRFSTRAPLTNAARLPDFPRGTDRTRNIYDSIGITASERLTAGLESLITPQAAFWHSFASAGEFDVDPEAEQGQWYEVLRNYLFTTRYDPRCGFPLANQRAMRSMIGLGHGIIFIEEAFMRGHMATPCYYQFIPVQECYLDTNPQSMHDTNFRVFSRSAKQLEQQFGKEKLSVKTNELLSKPETLDQKVEVLHAVYPDKEGKQWCSQYIEPQNKHEITRGFFNEFPYIVYQWLPIDGSAYAESPAMLAMAELKSLQAMGRDSLIASQQSIRPALASAYAPDVPVNMNPGAVNPKMIDPNTGRLLVQPILQSANPQLFQAIMLLRREQVKDALYLNLWMSLSQNGVLSATEATIRAAEKGELLGPAASRVQHALSMLVDREIAIVERKGGFLPNSPLRPPASLAGKKVNVRFTAPIDKMRRAGDASGIQRTVEVMIEMAKLDSAVVDNLDSDSAIDIVRDRLGAPRKMFKLPAERDAERQRKQQQQNMTAAAGAAQPLASGAKDAASAMKTIQEMQAAGGAGLMPGMSQ